MASRSPKAGRLYAYPDRIADRYGVWLARIIGEAVAAANAEVLEEYETRSVSRDDELRTDVISSWVRRWFESSGVRVRITGMVDRANPSQGVLGFGTQGERWNRQQHSEVMPVLLAVNPLRSEPWLVPMMAAWRTSNVNLITALPGTTLDRIEELVEQAWSSGLSTPDLARLLEGRIGMAQRRAMLIARDQMGKLNGQLIAMRQTAAGVTQYRWSTAKDERVRQTHADLEGQVFSWHDPPPIGHPGTPIQCRCTAQPEDLERLLTPRGLRELGTPAHAQRVHAQMRDTVRSLGQWAQPDELRAIMGALPSIDDVVAAMRPGPGTAFPMRQGAPRVPRVQRAGRGGRTGRTGRLASGTGAGGGGGRALPPGGGGGASGGGGGGRRNPIEDYRRAHGHYPREIDIVDANRRSIVELDGIEPDRFVENKDGRGLTHSWPSSRRDVDQWFLVHFERKMVRIVQGVQSGVSTMARRARGATRLPVPGLSDFDSIRTVEWRVSVDDRSLLAYLQTRLDALSKAYPAWSLILTHVPVTHH